MKDLMPKVKGKADGKPAKPDVASIGIVVIFNSIFCGSSEQGLDASIQNRRDQSHKYRAISSGRSLPAAILI